MSLKTDLEDIADLIDEYAPFVDDEDEKEEEDTTFTGKDIIRLYEKHLTLAERREVEDYFYYVARRPPEIEEDLKDAWDILEDIWNFLHDIDILFDVLSIQTGSVKAKLPGPKSLPKLPKP